MGSAVRSSTVLLDLPDFTHLCCVTLTLREEEKEPRSEQMKICRELVLLHTDVLASAAPESFTEITVVMALQLFHTGVIQMFGKRRRLMLGPPQRVSPAVLQACLSFSVTTRLSPSWNKAGLFLVSGKDFVSERGKMDAVRVEWNASEDQLCISVEANTIRAPPPTLEDLDLAPCVLRRFWSHPDSFLELPPAGRVWCHVLPSMKKGQIIRISHKLPQDGPFRTYGDLQNHWMSLYGYTLPELPEEELVYCSIYFRLVGERLFTYPLSCIRLQQVQRCPRRDQQGALSAFLSDVRTSLHNVCGFPTCLSRKRSRCTDAVSTPVQVLGDDINTAATSCRSPPLPQVPNVPHQLPTMPHFASQHSTQGSSQQERAQRLQDCGFRTGLSHGSASSSSSSEQSTPPKLVPIFTKRRPSRQASLALLRLRRQKERLPGASGETSHLTPMTFPAHNLVRAPPGQPRLWAPPAAKFRCPLKTTTEQSSEAIPKHRTSSDSSSQVTSAGPDVERRTRSGEPALPQLVS
ncbi:uncharacterized protein C18orf63 [Takifugu flavidus]|uniref:uncharacterized protein C18orf63 n=1 Tax=Takifugu flavidus TaxID=433684 RepID=UPI0025445ECF|nr:uncharacterized protein C18orf63 [Takifugu flavidus]XP_056868633.1 uncharacterized protein C18orf63 [Takifugu flavidus]XP_056868634.1 uncharacterized protein C18orf63 [Takifugu flavidus]